MWWDGVAEETVAGQVTLGSLELQDGEAKRKGIEGEIAVGS